MFQRSAGDIKEGNKRPTREILQWKTLCLTSNYPFKTGMRISDS